MVTHSGGHSTYPAGVESSGDRDLHRGGGEVPPGTMLVSVIGTRYVDDLWFLPLSGRNVGAARALVC